MKPIHTVATLFGIARPAPLANRSARRKCAPLLHRLDDSLAGKARPWDAWVRRHAESCPRCRRRLQGLGNLQTAMMLLKTQAQGPGLLARANRHAIAALHHDIRALPATQALRNAQPRPPLVQRLAAKSHYILQAAACLAVAMLLRVDLISPVAKFQHDARIAYQNHQAQQIDEDLRDGLS